MVDFHEGMGIWQEGFLWSLDDQSEHEAPVIGENEVFVLLNFIEAGNTRPNGPPGWSGWAGRGASFGGGRALFGPKALFESLRRRDGYPPGWLDG